MKKQKEQTAQQFIDEVELYQYFRKEMVLKLMEMWKRNPSLLS
jgi:hypothetical protein